MSILNVKLKLLRKNKQDWTTKLITNQWLALIAFDVCKAPQKHVYKSSLDVMAYSLIVDEFGSHGQWHDQNDSRSSSQQHGGSINPGTHVFVHQHPKGKHHYGHKTYKIGHLQRQKWNMRRFESQYVEAVSETVQTYRRADPFVNRLHNQRRHKPTDVHDQGNSCNVVLQKKKKEDIFIHFISALLCQ